MKIIVTGGAGFIGSTLCDFLVLEGHQLIVIDDLSSGYLSNLDTIKSQIDFYEKKVEDFDFTRLDDIDVVFHLAAQASVPVSVEEFERSSTTNLLSMLSVMDYCRKNTIPLVYASSSAVYGNQDLGDDKKNNIDLLSPYATDKYAMELYARMANQLYGLPSFGLRFYNVYGPRQDPKSAYSGVISIFIDRLLDGENIIINGGYQTRDFVYVDDVVRALHKSMLLLHEDITCEQINILTGRSISVDDVADMLIEITGSQGSKIYRELPLGDPEFSKGTTRKMEEILKTNMSKLVPIDIGLKSTVDFLRA